LKRFDLIKNKNFANFDFSIPASDGTMESKGRQISSAEYSAKKNEKIPQKYLTKT
jgi:hypothetical protein